MIKQVTDREKARMIAKLAYQEIMSSINRIEKLYPEEIDFCWDRCVWVDDEFFHEKDLI